MADEIKVKELLAELQREDPEARIIIWAAEPYDLGDIYAGEPGEVELHVGDEIEGHDESLR